MGPIRGGGGFPPWAWRQGWGPLPPRPAHSPLPWEFSPTWGRGGGSHPPLAYIRRGRPPFSKTSTHLLFLLLLPGSGLPLFGVCTWIGVLHHKADRRSAGGGIRSCLSSAALLVRGPGGTSIVPYVYNLFEALHLWCYFIAGGLSRVILAAGLLHNREVVVLSLRQPRSQERFPLSIFKGMNTDSLRYFTSP